MPVRQLSFSVLVTVSRYKMDGSMQSSAFFAQLVVVVVGPNKSRRKTLFSPPAWSFTMALMPGARGTRRGRLSTYGLVARKSKPEKLIEAGNMLSQSTLQYAAEQVYQNCKAVKSSWQCCAHPTRKDHCLLSMADQEPWLESAKIFRRRWDAFTSPIGQPCSRIDRSLWRAMHEKARIGAIAGN